MSCVLITALDLSLNNQGDVRGRKLSLPCRGGGGGRWLRRSRDGWGAAQPRSAKRKPGRAQPLRLAHRRQLRLRRTRLAGVPHPSRRCAPIHLPLQGRKSRLTTIRTETRGAAGDVWIGRPWWRGAGSVGRREAAHSPAPQILVIEPRRPEPPPPPPPPAKKRNPVSRPPGSSLGGRRGRSAALSGVVSSTRSHQPAVSASRSAAASSAAPTPRPRAAPCTSILARSARWGWFGLPAAQTWTVPTRLPSSACAPSRIVVPAATHSATPAQKAVACARVVSAMKETDAPPATQVEQDLGEVRNARGRLLGRETADDDLGHGSGRHGGGAPQAFRRESTTA